MKPSSYLRTIVNANFFILSILLIGFSEGKMSAQSSLERFFPEVLDAPDPSVLLIWETGQKLGMSIEEFAPLSNNLLEEYHAAMTSLVAESNLGDLTPDQAAEKIAQIRRFYVAAFTSELDFAQLQIAERILVSNYLQKTFRPESIEFPSTISRRLPLFLLNNGVVGILGISPQQKFAIEKALAQTNSAWEAMIESNAEKIKTIFAAWQQELYEELLPFQKDTFDNAIGEPWVFSSQFSISSFNGEASNLFLKSSQELAKSRLRIIRPNECYMLLETPFYVDAPLHPQGLFSLLLSREIIEELQLSDRQKSALETLKSKLDSEASLPELLQISPTYGSDMGPQQQRSAARNAQQEFGSFHAGVDEILNRKQSNRLRQIGNQYLLSVGWDKVPLMFPDWKSYLELSQQQKVDFDRIKGKYIEQLKRQLLEFEREGQKLVRNCNREISGLLSEKQIVNLTDLLDLTILLD